MLKLDHIAVSCETLEEGRVWVEERLGTPLQTGGAHERFGTHNLLMELEEGLYLELIAINPEAPSPKLRRWFDLDDFSGAPRVTNWICAADDLSDALALAPNTMGAPYDMARGDLRWKFTGGENGALPFSGGFPAILDWGDSPHPATRLPQSGVRLERLVISNPDAEALRQALQPLFADARVVIVEGAKSMRAEFSSPRGQLVLE